MGGREIILSKGGAWRELQGVAGEDLMAAFEPSERRSARMNTRVHDLWPVL